MTWQILIAISVAAFAVQVLLQRLVLRDDRAESISFSIFYQLGVAVVSTIFVVISQGGIVVPDMSGIAWNIVIMAVLYSIVNVLAFKSLKITEASRFTVIFASKTLFAILASTLIFGEGLTSTQWLGAICIILGVVTVSLRDTKLQFNKGDFFALLAAVVVGLANTNDSYLVDYMDPNQYVVIGFLLPGILIAMTYPSKVKHLKVYFQKSFIYKMLMLCGLTSISAITFFAALKYAPNASEVFSINALGAVVTVALSIIFLKERDYLVRKLIGTVVSVAGLLLVNQ